VYEFHTTEPIMVSVRLRAGAAALTAEERDTTVVAVTAADNSEASQQQAENTIVELQGDTLVVHAPEGGWLWRRGGIRVDVRVPVDSGFVVQAASADSLVRGRWRQGSATTASGDVRIEQVTGDLRVSSASGAVNIGAVGGDLQVKSASGDVDTGSVAGRCVLHSASGDLRVQDLGGSAEARTASGDIDLLRARRDEVRAQSASGDVTVSVLPGTGVFMDVSTVSGSTRSDLDVGDAPPSTRDADGETLAVRVNTVSGDVTVRRAPSGDRAHQT
jgi:hypothetical protein